MKVTAINYFRTGEGTLGLMMTQSFILLDYESLNHDFLKRKLNPVVSLQSAGCRSPVNLSITSSFISKCVQIITLVSNPVAAAG